LQTYAFVIYVHIFLLWRSPEEDFFSCLYLSVPALATVLEGFCVNRVLAKMATSYADWRILVYNKWHVAEKRYL